jgi:hypothetical protein
MARAGIQPDQDEACEMPINAKAIAGAISIETQCGP